MSSVRDQLKQAHTLIRQDQLAEARQLLAPILESDPQNVHAWWLWAYAVEDPHEVREALNQVLTIDPDYREAPKAREMLQALEEQYFSAQPAAAEQDVRTEQGEPETFDASTFLEDTPAFEETPDAFGTADETFFDSEEALLAEFDEALQATGEDTLSAADFLSDEGIESDVDVHALEEFMESEPDFDTDDEAAAVADERAAQAGAGPVRWFARALVALALIAVIVVGVWYVFLRDEAGSSNDPGPLSIIELEAPSVQSALSAVEAQFVAEGIAQAPKAVVAETPLGSALVVEFCSEPAPGLADVVSRGMRIVAEHSSDVGGDVKAVGVSVNRCVSQTDDTLYRAVVAVDDAQAYITGQYGDGEYGWVEFQNRWRKL